MPAHLILPSPRFVLQETEITNKEVDQKLERTVTFCDKARLRTFRRHPQQKNEDVYYSKKELAGMRKVNRQSIRKILIEEPQVPQCIFRLFSRAVVDSSSSSDSSCSSSSTTSSDDRNVRAPIVLRRLCYSQVSGLELQLCPAVSHRRVTAIRSVLTTQEQVRSYVPTARAAFLRAAIRPASSKAQMLAQELAKIEDEYV